MAELTTQQVLNELSSLTQAIRSLVDNMSKASSSVKDLIQDNEEFADQINEFNKNFKKTNGLSKEEIALQKKANDAHLKELKLAKERSIAEQNLKNVTNNTSKAFKDAQERVNKLAAAETAAHTETTSALNRANASMGGLASGSKLAEAGLVFFGNVAVKEGELLAKTYKESSGIIEGSSNILMSLFQRQFEALKLGLSGADQVKIANSARQMINAMGGTNDAFKQLDPTISKFQILTGDMAGGAQLAMDSAKDLATKGVNPTTVAMEAYSNDVINMHKLTGIGLDQSRRFFDEIASDSDSIELLRKTRAGERSAILQSQRALVQQAIAAGMSAEQAKEAAKMLNRMVAAKPLDRIRQAARIRALGGALGIAGANEAAQAVMAGPRASAAQREAIQQFGIAAANAVNQAGQQGFGAELFASTLVDKLDLAQQFGPNSSFSTELGGYLIPQQKALDEQVEFTKSSWAELFKVLARINGALGTFGLSLGGVATGLGVLSAVLLGGGVLGRVLGGAAKSAAPLAGSVAGSLGGAGKWLGRAGGLAGIGIGGYEAYDEYTSGHKGAGIGAGVGTALGAGLGFLSPMPGGAALGAFLGSQAGKWVGSQFDTGPTGAAEAVNAQANDAAQSLVSNSQAQLAKMDNTTTLLKQIADTANRQADIADKQLLVMTMTEKERTNKNTRLSILAEDRFASQYGYLQ